MCLPSTVFPCLYRRPSCVVSGARLLCAHLPLYFLVCIEDLPVLSVVHICCALTFHCISLSVQKNFLCCQWCTSTVCLPSTVFPCLYRRPSCVVSGAHLLCAYLPLYFLACIEDLPVLSVVHIYYVLTFHCIFLSV